MKYQIDFDDDELQAATDWHGDIGSMLYAVASTGSLKRGTHRPRLRCECASDPTSRGCKACQGALWIPLTDAEWFADIAWRLAAESEECAAYAAKEARNAGRKRREELRANRRALLSIAAKATAAAEAAEKSESCS